MSDAAAAVSECLINLQPRLTFGGELVSFYPSNVVHLADWVGTLRLPANILRAVYVGRLECLAPERHVRKQRHHENSISTLARRSVDILYVAALCAASMTIAAADEQGSEREAARVPGSDASPPQRAVSEGVLGEVTLQRAPDEATVPRAEDEEQHQATIAERRAQTRSTHPELEIVLRVDAETEERLIDLLSEPQMSELERASQISGPYPKAGLQAQLDAWNRQLDALRSLLGETGLEQYQIYMATLSERAQANVFDALLAPKDKLELEQKDKLIALFQESNRRQSKRVFGDRPMLSTVGLPPGEETQRILDLELIAAQERALRELTPFHRWFAERAAQFLTGAQLVALAKMHEREETALKRGVAQARSKAGLVAATANTAAAPIDGAQGLRHPISTDVQLDLAIAVNGNSSVHINHMSRSGETVIVELADGLIVEATPTVYDDDWMWMETRYYEQRSARRRPLGTTSYFGMRIRRPDSPEMQFGDNEVFVMGSKVYLISTRIGAAPL